MDKATFPPIFIAHGVGIESGMTLQDNIRSLEAQRTKPGGLFFWGVGCSISEETIKKILKETDIIRVLFYHIVSAPRPQDAKGLSQEEKSVRLWTRPLTRDGAPYDLPDEAQVVSHDGEKTQHFALVCRSNKPLAVDTEGAFFYRDELLTFPKGKQLGSGSLYAVKYSHLDNPRGAKYQIVMEAELVFPYVIKFKAADSRVIHGRIDGESGKYPV